VCAACVAQGVTYVGGALGTLRLMAARAETRRTRAGRARPGTGDTALREDEAATTTSC
jgi:hypothetical protein